MNAWQSSWPYRLWVVGGLIGVVAFAVIGGTSDPSNQDFILTLIPVIAVWVAGIFILQWRALQRERRDRPATSEPAAGLVKWNIIFGALVCVAIFAGVYLFYADVGGTFYPLGDGGPGLVPPLLGHLARAYGRPQRRAIRGLSGELGSSEHHPEGWQSG